MLVYSVGSGVNRVQVLSGFSMRSFCVVVFSWLQSCLCV